MEKGVRMVWNNPRNNALQKRAQRLIPGGMYSRMPTGPLPHEFPQFFQRGKGCRIWDVDGNEYIDFMCAFAPEPAGLQRSAGRCRRCPAEAGRMRSTAPATKHKRRHE
ncbi:hypothetical protein [Variovorax sp. AFSI2.2]|uniref:hypothetical protein n=1 Tax=Variovorax sp. AFSI2.2 TaxID=3384160 RepID=UPI003EBB6ABF